jgi:hypothetical protein
MFPRWRSRACAEDPTCEREPFFAGRILGTIKAYRHGRARHRPPDEPKLIERIRRADPAAVIPIIPRRNQHLHRIARRIVRDDSEAEDVL